MLMSVMMLLFFVKQKTAYEMRISDWSSDVCSSDLTLSGTSWSRSLRRVAVTTMSAGLVAESVLFAVAASAGRLSSAGAALVWAAAGAAATINATNDDVQAKQIGRAHV